MLKISMSNGVEHTVHLIVWYTYGIHVQLQKGALWTARQLLDTACAHPRSPSTITGSVTLHYWVSHIHPENSPVLVSARTKVDVTKWMDLKFMPDVNGCRIVQCNPASDVLKSASESPAAYTVPHDPTA